MALSDIELCSRALVRLGASPIDAFDGQSAEARVAEALYPPVRDAMLSAYAWSFCTAQGRLVKLPDAPLADYAHAFALPDNYLRAISAGGGSKGRGVNYRIMNGALHAHQEEIVLTYLFKAAEEDFPPFFDAALITRLAAEFSIPVTESTSRTETLIRWRKRNLPARGR
jgi:hypothetical protein